MYDLTPVVLENIDRLGIDVLVTIGGDDTLSFSRTLVDHGVPLVAIPKTMDNDVAGTEYCIGFSIGDHPCQGAHQSPAHDARQPRAHRRVPDLRARRRLLGAVHRVRDVRPVRHPRAPYDIDSLAQILAEDHRDNPSHYAIVITAEGAIWQGAAMQDIGEADMFGHRHKANIGEVLAAELKRRTGIEAVASELTYDLRSGEPDMLDAMVAMTFANVAMDLVADGETGRMAAIRDGKYSHTELPEPGHPRAVDVATMYNVERFRPRYDGREGEPLLLLDLGVPVHAG